jgi:hypothetical protein
MSIIAKPYTYVKGTNIYASEANLNFDTIYNDYNGNISNANIVAGAGIVYSKLSLTGNIVNADISSGAAITDDKLSQITTASKVSGTAITGLASLPAGAGVIPSANVPATTVTNKIGYFTLDLSFVGGNSAYTGIGFKPSYVNIISQVVTGAIPVQGFDNGTSHYCDFAAGGTQGISSSYSIIWFSGPGAWQGGYVTSLDNDGFTINWTKTGSPTGTLKVIYTAFK